MLKGRFAMLFVMLSLTGSSLMAWDCCEQDMCCNRKYVGIFGGGVFSTKASLTQLGTAFFTEAEGGPLAVSAKGHAKSTSSGFGGIQIGYEWKNCPVNFGCSGWNLTTAAELEAFIYRNHKKGHLINPSDRLPEHDFLDTFHLRTRVLMVNAVFSFNNSCFCGLTPYLGFGIGAASTSLKNAKSLQVSPEEPGINHFNSGRSDSTWAFASQLKAGLRYNICGSFHIFGEYRYMYIGSFHYVLGSTAYPTHAATSPWNVKMGSLHNNAFALGVQLDF